MKKIAYLFLLSFSFSIIGCSQPASTKKIKTSENTKMLADSTKLVEQHFANKLSLSDVPCKVVVKTSTETKTITFRASNELKKLLKIKESSEMLSITGNFPANTNNTINISSNGSSNSIVMGKGNKLNGVKIVQSDGENSISINGNGSSVIINGKKINLDSIKVNSVDLDKMILEIEMPISTELLLNGEMGNVVVGDMKGKFSASLTGFDFLNIGAVKDASFTLSSSSDVKINQINGDLDIIQTGSGDFRVNSGNIKTLTLISTGSGDINLHANTETASIQATGSGDIKITKVNHVIRQNHVGSGDIIIGN
jgi:hypothetical protein